MSRNPYDEGENPFEKASTVSDLITSLAGAASVAWDQPPQGIFESTWASYLCDQAEIQLAKIQERQYDSKPDVVELALTGVGEIESSNDQGTRLRQEIVDSLVALGVPRVKAMEWVNG